jgi:hypothetical protein
MIDAGIDAYHQLDRDFDADAELSSISIALWRWRLSNRRRTQLL